MKAEGELAGERPWVRIGRAIKLRTLKRIGNSVLLIGVFGDLTYHGITEPRSVFVPCCGLEFFTHGIIVVGVLVLVVFGLLALLRHWSENVSAPPGRRVAAFHQEPRVPHGTEVGKDLVRRPSLGDAPDAK